MRSGLEARRSPPTSCQPGSLPVSRRRSAYRPTEYIIIRVRLTDDRSWPTSPAECQVDPDVRSYCSTSTTFQPSRARWYAMLAPPTPPPITTAWASLLMDDPPIDACACRA